MRKYRSSIALIMLLLICFILCAKQGLAEANSAEELESALQHFEEYYLNTLTANGYVGSSFMLIHDNHLIYKKSYGYADRENQLKMSEEKIFHWASITKTLTGIAIMQLRDRGLLNLDDPIIQYIPELKEVYNPHGDMNDITIRHLMTHSAGFRRETWPWGNKPWHPHAPLYWDQLVAMFPYTKIQFKPGTRHSYSNPGIIFLGRIIELLTTDDYEVYVDKNILKPLEMHRSYFDATPYHLLKYKSRSYWLKDGKLTQAKFDINTGITVSNGGLNAPFTDFTKYINFLMGDEDKTDIYEVVLKRSSLEEMFKPQIEIVVEELSDYDKVFYREGRNRKDHMGLTFFVEDNYGMRFVLHEGGQNAFMTHFVLNPELRTAYVIGYNTREGVKTLLMDLDIKDYLYENIFPFFKQKK